MQAYPAHNPTRPPYPSHVSDAAGAFVAPYLTPRRLGSTWSRGHVLSPSELREAPLEEPAFALVEGQLKGVLVGGTGLVRPAEPAQQFGLG